MSAVFDLSGRIAVLTGATGGIGGALAQALGKAGVRLVLSGRNRAGLDALAADLPAACVQALVEGSLADATTRQALCTQAADCGASILVNAMGINQLCLFGEQEEAVIERLIATNLLAPLLLTRAMLPALQAQDSAMIVNIGSVFGTIGHPGYTAYSATKFGLRGFSEALQRELADTTVRVVHVEPRATRTTMNDGSARSLNQLLGNAEDPPSRVAAITLQNMRLARPRTTIGWPERFFAHLNRMWPSVVDRALAARLPLIRSGIDTHRP